MTLLTQEIKITRYLKISEKEAKAIGDPIRYKILRLLQEKELSAIQITYKINKENLSRMVLTTIHYHIGVLLDAKLIDITKIQPKKGSFTKIYTAKIGVNDA